jgi:hypothetical protein
MRKLAGFLVVVLSLACAASALAQTLPTSQPNFLQIIREEVKPGRAADHAAVEAGWPAAFEKAKNPYTYIALTTMTGTNEVWFVVPFQSQEAMGDSMAREEDAALAPTLARLQKADAEHLVNTRSILAMARKDLSHGSFPEVAKQRFYEITIYRVRPGHERTFAAAAKAYAAGADRSAPGTSFRVYEVMAGMPGPTYLVFSSTAAYGAFDKAMADDEAIMKGATAEERSVFDKFSAEALINSETIRFKLDPVMSYVPASLRAQDTSFWGRKPPAAPAMASAVPKPKAGEKPVATAGATKR